MPWHAVCTLLTLLLPLYASAQRTIQVPTDQPTIQQGIAVAANGDTVSIAPGTYTGAVDFMGKAITVAGSAPGVVLMGNASGPVVFFRSGEGRSSVLKNVTVQGGAATSAQDAGGIFIDHASPTIQGSIVTGNTGCGIGVHSGAPLITGNTIIANTGTRNSGCVTPDLIYTSTAGGGIILYNAPSNGMSAEVNGNTIQANKAVWNAAGITAVNAGHLIVQNNVISGNQSNGQGAGVLIFGDTSATIVQNLIYANVIDPTLVPQAYADIGSGLNIDLTNGSQRSTRTVVVNNSIVNNSVLFEPGARLAGSQVVALNYYDSISFYNNIIVSTDSYSAIDCNDSARGLALPVFDHNLVFTQGPSASHYSGDCPAQAGSKGNLAANPLFAPTQAGVSPYQLQAGSPAIDSGNNNAPALLQTDFLGHNRLQNATGTPSAIIDMGVYEVAGVPGTLPPPVTVPPVGFSISLNPASLSLQTQHHGVVAVTVTVTGSLNGSISLDCGNLPAHASCAFDRTSVSITGPGTYLTWLTVDTSDVRGYASNRRGPSWTQFAFLFPFTILLGCRKRLRGQALVLVAGSFAIFAMSACSGKLPAATMPGSYSVNVIGTNASSSQTAQAQLSLSVLP